MLVNENAARSGNGNRRGNLGNVSGPSVTNPVTDPSAYVGLPPRDRAAIQQSRNDQYPEEYGPLIEQYLRNLSEQKR